MFYGTTTLATDFPVDDWQVKMLRLLLFFIPRANPDNEKLYPLVKKWYLEIGDDGIVVREIGIDAESRPLFAAPNQRNYGFWLDSSKTFTNSELDPISNDQFEKLWQEAKSLKLK
jgi:hypothetical protein